MTTMSFVNMNSSISKYLWTALPYINVEFINVKIELFPSYMSGKCCVLDWVWAAYNGLSRAGHQVDIVSSNIF